MIFKAFSFVSSESNTKYCTERSFNTYILWKMLLVECIPGCCTKCS